MPYDSTALEQKSADKMKNRETSRIIMNHFESSQTKNRTKNTLEFWATTILLLSSNSKWAYTFLKMVNFNSLNICCVSCILLWLNLELLNVKIISFCFYLYFLSRLLREDYIIIIFSEDRRWQTETQSPKGISHFFKKKRLWLPNNTATLNNKF